MWVSKLQMKHDISYYTDTSHITFNMFNISILCDCHRKATPALAQAQDVGAVAAEEPGPVACGQATPEDHSYQQTYQSLAQANVVIHIFKRNCYVLFIFIGKYSP